MKKIKYQGGFTKLVCQKIARVNRRKFSKLLPNLKLPAILVNKPGVKLDVVSFSSGSDFEEQVLSIFSFMRHVGIPRIWHVYSDGTHSEFQMKWLEENLPFIRFADANIQIQKASLFNDELLKYAKSFPLGKRFLLYINHKIEIPTFFLDADVLFYEKMSSLIDILIDDINKGWYLMDCGFGTLDSRFLNSDKQQLYQVNGGFYIANKEVDWTEGLHFIGKLNGKYEYFSEQTAVHISLYNQLRPLDPRLFIMDAQDQFDFSYKFNRKDIALRHYVSPIRHKMWQHGWQWHLSM